MHELLERRRWYVLAFVVCLTAWSLPAAAQTIDENIPPKQEPSSPLLNALQLSFVPLEAVDAYTTLRGVRQGLIETNPVMRGSSRHAVALVAVKAAAATSTILLTRRLAKKNRVAAVAIMAALNGSYATIALHNLRQHRR